MFLCTFTLSFIAFVLFVQFLTNLLSLVSCIVFLSLNYFHYLVRKHFVIFEKQLIVEFCNSASQEREAKNY